MNTEGANETFSYDKQALSIGTTVCKGVLLKVNVFWGSSFHALQNTGLGLGIEIQFVGRRDFQIGNCSRVVRRVSEHVT